MTYYTETDLQALKMKRLREVIIEVYGANLGFDQARDERTASKHNLIQTILFVQATGELPEQPNEEPEPEQPETSPMPKQANNPAQQLFEAVQAVSNASVDEQQVINLIKQHAPAAAPVEITVNTKNASKTVPTGLQHNQLPKLITMLAAQCHVWLAGPAGSGKTYMAEQAAQALELPFYSTGAVTSPFQLTGFVNAEGLYQPTTFRDAFENGGLFLWDEVDASNPNALVAFNQALANGYYGFPDGMVKRHDDFVCIAAANTYGHGATSEYVGRIRQDGAMLDRFVKLPIDYDEQLERQLAGDNPNNWCDQVHAARQACTDHGIKAIISLRAIVQGVRLLKAGLSVSDTWDATILAGLDDNSADKLRTIMDGV